MAPILTRRKKETPDPMGPYHPHIRSYGRGSAKIPLNEEVWDALKIPAHLLIDKKTTLFVDRDDGRIVFTIIVHEPGRGVA